MLGDSVGFTSGIAEKLPSPITECDYLPHGPIYWHWAVSLQGGIVASQGLFSAVNRVRDDGA